MISKDDIDAMADEHPCPSETMRDIIKRKLNQSLSDQNYQAAEIYVGWLSDLKTLDEK